MHSEYYETLIHKHLTGTLSDQEQRDLAAWLKQTPENRQQLEEAKRIWSLTEAAGSEIDVDVSFEIERFKQGIGKPASTSARIIPFWQYAAAAALLIGGILFFLRGGWGTAHQVAIATGSDETRMIVLPDSSTVWLNADSRLTYDEPFDTRRVSLEGEGYFDVRHDPARSFRIDAGAGEVQVLGTAFNVRNVPQEPEIKVTVARGRVALRSKETAEEHVLTAGYLGILTKENASLQSQPNHAPDALFWHARPLAFNAASMNDVAEALGEHYAIVIEELPAGLQACTFTGQFVNPPLSDVLETLAFSLDVSVSVHDGVYAFSGIGCSP